MYFKYIQLFKSYIFNLFLKEVKTLVLTRTGYMKEKKKQKQACLDVQ